MAIYQKVIYNIYIVIYNIGDCVYCNTVPESCLAAETSSLASWGKTNIKCSFQKFFGTSCKQLLRSLTLCGAK